MMPWAEIWELEPIVASLEALTIFNATATPIPTLVSPTALPSAIAAASVSFDAANLRVPLVLITKLFGSVTDVLDLARFRAMAPATPT